MNQKEFQKRFKGTEKDLVERFGHQRLEEMGFPVYFHSFPPASYLGWERVRAAQKLLRGCSGDSALDFGSGLGVMLPFLTQSYRHVTACEREVEVTQFVATELGYQSIEFIKKISECKPDTRFDAVVSLDVLEHVEDLDETMNWFVNVTAKDGVWVISGPTENKFYKTARMIAGTRGKGHVRNIYDVFDSFPSNMKCEKIYTLPWGIPLFLVGKFRRIS